MGAQYRCRVKPAGTVSTFFRIPVTDRARAITTLTEAGFVTTVEDEVGEVHAACYPGVYRPNPEVQVQCREKACAALQQASVEFEVTGSALASGGVANPFEATGALFDRNDRFLGTCFAFRYAHLALTARHCVDRLEAEDLSVQFFRDSEPKGALEITRHPEADVAIVRLPADRWPRIVFPFTEIGELRGWGDEYAMFGFPEDTSPAGFGPTPRVLRGYFQRTYAHDGRWGKYQALELSTPAPAGMSGGAAFSIDNRHDVFGLAAENRTSTTYLGRTVEERADGRLSREIHERDVVQYGVAVLLHPLRNWCDELIPADRPPT